MNRFSTNSRVCFIGDSITAAGRFTEYVAQHYAEKLDSSGVRFYVGAVPGGTAASQRVFFKDDVLIYKPDHAVIMLGVNDSSSGVVTRQRGDEARYRIAYDCYENYKANLNALIDLCEQNNIKVTLCSPTPYAEFQDEGCEPARGALVVMQAYADYCRYLAEKRGLEFCDVYSYIVKEMQTATLFGPDRVHPNVQGHYKIAECLLSSMGFNNYEPKELEGDFQKRAEVRGKLSQIYATELMVLGLKRYELPLNEKYEYVKYYLENKLYRDNYFKDIAEKYLVNKPLQEELYKEYIKLTDVVSEYTK